MQCGFESRPLTAGERVTIYEPLKDKGKNHTDLFRQSLRNQPGWARQPRDVTAPTQKRETMLKEKTLFETIDKVKMSIERLKQFEPPEGYHLAFSGGKDSIVIKELAEMSGVKFKSHYAVTTIDPPELIYFMRKYHKDVIFDRPEVALLTMLSTKGFPMRQSRWCCAEYKERLGAGEFVVTGVRSAESPARAKRRMTEVCYNDNTKRFLHVIFDWEEEDVWSFIKERKLPYCSLYDEGWHRIGCLFCPMARKQRAVEAKRYPKYAKAFIRAFEKLYKNRKDSGITSVDRWKNGEEMFWWWMDSDPPAKDKPDQMVMFE